MARKPETEQHPSRRQHNKRWQGIYGSDRAYTARVDRAKKRGQWTPPMPKKEAA